MGRPAAVLSERGSALLVVVAAGAAIGALAVGLLGATLVSYEIAVVEHQGEQARLFAASALDAVATELSSGRLALPLPGMEVVWRRAAPVAGLPPGCGFEVRVRSPLAADGSPLRDRSTPAAVLLDASAVGRCGRGLETRQGRYRRGADGSVTRLY